MKGTILFWSNGWGWIKSNAVRRRLFVNHVDLINCKELKEGDNIEFNSIVETMHGLQAKNVKKVD